MDQPTNPFIPFGAGELPELGIQADLTTRGAAYLRWVQQLALAPDMIAIPPHPDDQLRLCQWLGGCIEVLNAQLSTYLAACQACFHPEARRSPIQVLATPLNPNYCLDAVCNVMATPVTILVDPGRVVPEDWLKLVAHEYAHAHVGTPGHGDRFREVITHLCLGLGFEPPPTTLSPDLLLRQWPPCRPTPDPTAFWLQG